MSSTTALAGLISSLDLSSGAEDIFSQVRTLINNNAFPEPSSAFKIEVWCLFVAHALVMVLSIFGVVARYWRKTGWLFAKEDNGLVRPNTAIVTQLCFMLYSFFVLIVTPTYSFKSHPTEAAFVFLMLSFIPLGVAFHFTVWATTLAPSTSLKFLSSGRPTRVTRHGKLTTYLMSLILALFILATIPPTIIMSFTHRQEMATVRDLLGLVDEAEKGGQGLAGLAVLLPDYEKMVELKERFLHEYYALAGVYLFFLVLWICAYVPAAIRLISTLHTRKCAFERSINSLKVLDDIVTTDGQDDTTNAKPEFTIVVEGNSVPLTTVAYPPRAHRRGSFAASRDPKSDDSDTASESSEQSKSPKLGGKGKKVATSKSAGQLRDLQRTLARTERMFWTITIQFILTTLMALSLLTFLSYLFTISIESVNDLFVPWVGCPVLGSKAERETGLARSPRGDVDKSEKLDFKLELELSTVGSRSEEGEWEGRGLGLGQAWVPSAWAQASAARRNGGGGSLEDSESKEGRWEQIW
ncbi:hypothetical protein MNV49_005297 [Pseudohyphozyma bogoriensis]|nr:hypothetical protein MNV49_005297 [Pseudohyphozyma bogoriensis]